MGAARVDSKGHAYKGSQRQVQTWVNHHPDELNSAILRELPLLAASEPQITWQSPLRNDHYREYRDAAFLKQIGHPELADRLAEFWPSRGPVWDGFAT